MKRSYAILLGIGLIGVSIVTWVGFAHAQSFQTGGNTNVPQGKTVDGSLYAAGQTIDISGTVNGDVFCAGQSLNISGTVRGDVLCAAQTIDISGKVLGNIRVAGQSVDLSGTTNLNASVVAQTFNLQNGGRVLGDVSFVSHDVTLDGNIGRDVSGIGTVVNVGDSIGRNVKLTTANLTFNSGAKVSGNVNYIGDNPATINSGASVAHITQTVPAKSNNHGLHKLLFSFSVASFIYVLLASLLTVFVLVLVLPKFFHETSEQAIHHLGSSILFGIVTWFVVFALLIALTITVIGGPLALILGLAWLLILGISLPVTAYYIGSMVLSKSVNPIPIALLGTLILVILLFLPIVGIIVGFISLWIGSGSVLRVVKNHYSRPSYNMGQPALANSKKKS